jgi:hypothetical protein
MPTKRISWHFRVPIELAISMLEPTLGWDKSAEVVETTARELGLPANNLTLSQVLRIFEALGPRPDLVGVAARFARTRLEGDTGRLTNVPRAPEVSKDAPPPSPPAPESPGRWIPVTELVDLLAPSLGVEKSASLVAATGADLGLAVNKLDMHGALAILSRLAKSEGLVGVVAKFAKAQLILKVTEPAAEGDTRPPDSSRVPSTERSPYQRQQDDKLGAERLDQLARKAGIAWVEWLHEDFAQHRAELPTAFPETHHGARVWLMRALPRASREALKEQDLDRMVHILFESARREWEGTTSSQG